MDNEMPFIHLFSTSEGYYLHDVNTDKILKIPEPVFARLQSGRSDVECSLDSCSVDEYIDNLKNNGFLKNNRVEEVEHPMTPYLEYCHRSKIGHMTLQITQRCNLRCGYCVYSGDYNNRAHSQKEMDFDTAKKAIDYLIAHSRDSKDISIGFYGGEPLLRFNFIKKCVEYAEQKAEGRIINYTTTTNGTLITEEKVLFFEQHDFSITISLDGPENIHDRHRRFAGSDEGSFKTIIANLNMLIGKFPTYYNAHVLFNTVMDPTNKFSEINEFVRNHEMLKERHFNAGLIDTRYSDIVLNFNEDYIAEWEYEKFKYFLAKLGWIKDSVASQLLDTVFATIERQRGGKQTTQMDKLPKKTHRAGPCVPGMFRLFVNVEGDFYPCERISEKSTITCIGNLIEGINLKKAERILNLERETSTRCCNCWAYLYCTACIGELDGMDSILPELRKNGCARIRKETEEIFKDYCMLRELGYDLIAEMTVESRETLKEGGL
ncbi:MAG: Cys-rich peptide radical SAM maturase CcpM [Clostridiales Family XIII bacterium]|jgi:uncharacterized protein|nr:Cys-rich peptide radical SAM maturase CcpM [Clostridiales Family XIII bacterium]